MKVVLNDKLYDIEKNDRGYYISTPFMLIDKKSWPLLEEGASSIFDAVVVREIRDKRGNLIPILSLTPHVCRNVPCGGVCICGRFFFHKFKELRKHQDSTRCGTILKCEICGAERFSTQPHDFEIDPTQWVMECSLCGYTKPLPISREEVEEIKRLFQEYNTTLEELDKIGKDPKIDKSIDFWIDFDWEWFCKYAPSELKENIPQIVFDYKYTRNHTIYFVFQENKYILELSYIRYSDSYGISFPKGGEEILLKEFASMEEVMKYFDIYTKEELKLLQKKKEELQNRLREIEKHELVCKAYRLVQELAPVALSTQESMKFLLEKLKV
ncbi:MAG: hypothetical protein QXM53_06785 [Thermofilaceae archaeon]